MMLKVYKESLSELSNNTPEEKERIWSRFVEDRVHLERSLHDAAVKYSFFPYLHSSIPSFRTHFHVPPF